MIQRIQTVWLFLAGLCVFLMFLFPYLQYFDLEGVAKVLKVTGLLQNVDGQIVQTEAFYLQTVVTVILGLFSFYIVFCFRNRKTQLKLIRINILLLLGFIAWLFWIGRTQTLALDKGLDLGNMGVGFFLPLIAIIFLILAARGVRRDEQLVRSADRLR